MTAQEWDAWRINCLVPKQTWILLEWPDGYQGVRCLRLPWHWMLGPARPVRHYHGTWDELMALRRIER